MPKPDKLPTPAKPFDPERTIKQISKMAGGVVILSYNPDVYRNTFVARAMPTPTRAREAVLAELKKNNPNGSIELGALTEKVRAQEATPLAQAIGATIEAALSLLRDKLKG